MSIDARCDCGRSFQFKPEYAGRSVACPDCGRSIAIPAVVSQADTAFDHDTFLLRQKRISINEVYDLRDAANNPILHARRPTYPFRRGLALLLGIVLFIVIFGGAAILASAASVDGPRPGDSPLVAVGILLGLVLGTLAALGTVLALSPKRHVTIFRDDTRAEHLLTVRQDAKFMPIRMTFTVVDAGGAPIGRLSKNVLYDLFRKRWRVTAADGRPLCTAFEDSIILSLLRRLIGPLYGLLRTNFLIVRGEHADGERLGEFNRKFTLFDRYVLNLEADPLRSLDRRLAVALGVMLDTGERR